MYLTSPHHSFLTSGPTSAAGLVILSKPVSNGTGNPYNVIYGAHPDDMLSVVHYCDDPRNTTWPLSAVLAPLTTLTLPCVLPRSLLELIVLHPSHDLYKY